MARAGAELREARAIPAVHFFTSAIVQVDDEAEVVSEIGSTSHLSRLGWYLFEFPVDGPALAECFRKYGYFVQRRCALLLANAADAEDVTQEVFMRAQHYSSSLTAPVSLSWLYSIAARCCFDRARQRKRDEPTAPDRLSHMEIAPAEASSPDERALVGQLLRGVDAQTSELAILYFLEGWTQEEIAARTGYSRKTIGKKLAVFTDDFRARWHALSSLRREVAP